MYNMLTGKFDGRLRKEIILPPNRYTRINMIRLTVKFRISERPTRFIDSLSDLGSTIASSYLKEEITIMIPTRLRYTEKIPNDSGEKSLLSTG
jgi:hypothetical protein